MKHRNQSGSPDMLLIHESIAMSVRDKSRFPELTVHSLLTVLGGFATLTCFQGFYQFEYNPLKMLLVLAVYSLITLMLRRISSRAAFVGVLLSFTVIPVMLLRHKEEAVCGVRTLYDVMNAAVMHAPPNYLDQPICGIWTDRDCLRFVFDLTVLAVAALLEYSDVLLLSRRSGHSGFLTRFLVTFPFLECGLYFGLETKPAAVFALAAFWIASLALVRVKVPKQEAKAKHGGRRARRDRCFTSNEISAVLLLCTAGLLSACILTATRNHVRTAKMDKKRDQILEAWHKVTVNDVTGLLQKLPGGKDMKTRGADIDLDDIERLDFNGSTSLNVTIGAPLIPEDLYFRGIVRGEYTGHGWANLNAAYFTNKSLFRRLNNSGRMPQTYFISEYAESMRLESGRFPVVNCTVKALNDESVNYLPYQSLCESGAKYLYDTEVSLPDTQNYSFWLFNTLTTDWSYMSVNQHSSEDKNVREYEELTRKLYCEVPENSSMENIRMLFDEWLDWSSGTSLDKIGDLNLLAKLELIREFLWDLCSYDTAPGSTPVGCDFSEYFLFTTRRGFCAHYATAGVLLCRMCGIPARYCQGYVLTQANRTRQLNANNWSFSIPDNQAHAWAEVYVDSYGWMPYEFTEGISEEWHSNDSPAMTATQATTTHTTHSFVTSVTTTRTTASSTKTSAQPVKQGSGALKITIRVLLILLILALPVLLWVLWHRAAVKRRLSRMHRKNPALSADAAFQFIIRLLELQNIRQGNLPHEEFACFAEEQCPLLKEGELQQAVETELAVVFSRNGISQEEAEQVCTLAESLAKALYQSSGKMRRFVLRWVHHIVM